MQKYEKQCHRNAVIFRVNAKGIIIFNVFSVKLSEICG